MLEVREAKYAGDYNNIQLVFNNGRKGMANLKGDNI
jgi:hypothetical protein